jgi:HEAT repeat protein
MSVRTIAVITIRLVVIIFAGAIVSCADFREPSYNGRSAIEWVKKGYFTDNRPLDVSRQVISPEEAEANQAIREIGVKAVRPFLRLLEVRSENGANPDVRAYMSNAYGSVGLSILGTNAVTAIPALKEILATGDYNQRRGAGLALYNMGFQGIAPLAEVLADDNSAGRAMAASFLSSYADPGIRLSADKMTSQKEIDGEGKVIVPILLRYVRDGDQDVRIWAIVGLGNFAQEPTLVIPSLIESCADTNRTIQLASIQALGMFGQNASNAVPILEDHASTGDSRSQIAVASTLERIRGKH